MASKILITGGTGLVGTKLTKLLQERSQVVNILTTSATRAENEGFFYWNIKDGYIDQKAFEDVSHIIHLAGAGVADKRWSKERKREIRDSRIKSTALLCERSEGHNIKGLISASAIGIYGFDTGENLLTEEDPHSSEFLAQVVSDWEHEIHGFETHLDQVVALRIGIVLSTKGGALKEMSTPFKFGLGSPLGSGRQWMSWIHIDDLVDMILFFLENNKSGTFNAIGPGPVRNRDFSKAVARALGRPMWLPNVPSFVLKLVFGELANVVIGGNKVSAEKIIKEGFEFKYQDLDDALKQLLRK